MSSDIDTIETKDPDTLVRAVDRSARTSIRVSLGNTKFQADAEITPMGLLAIGGMVAAILLAVAPIVTAAGKARRRR